MVYESKSDLPDTLREILPEEAQESYLQAYRASYENYEESQGGELDRESVAHRDAWAMMKRDFVEDEETGKWYRKGEVPEEDEDEDKSLLERGADMF